MKKFGIIFLCVVLLIPSGIFATNLKEPATEITEVVTAPIRDQDILVPTSEGVQKATYEEAVKIREYEKQSLETLTKSYLVGDFETGNILEAYNIDEVRGMASMYKLVAVYKVMDKMKDGTINLNDMVKIDHEAAIQTGSIYEVGENSEYTVESLLEASLVVSGNDSIIALAKYISGSTEEFVKLMNLKCKELGLFNAKMVNPTGLTNYEIEDYNKMTTKEMFLLTRALITEYPEVLKMSAKDGMVSPKTGKIIYATNPLLGIVPEIDGLKTGYTNAAGRCIIATGIENEVKGQRGKLRLIGITTGSSNDWKRYVASRRLMENAFAKYDNLVLSDPETPVTELFIEDGNPQKVKVYPKDQDTFLWSKDDELKKNIVLKEDLVAPIPPGTVVGNISYLKNGEEIYYTALVTKEEVREQSIFIKLQKLFISVFKNIEKAVI